ncbi:MAG: proton-conducting transporter membrane subunit [Halobacteria archaeon]|nr:proton-conducting transporter membrane subunit [Halobacteria archaeon]
MSRSTSKKTVGSLSDTKTESPFVPVALTWLVWSLFVVSTAGLVARVVFDLRLRLPGVLEVDGLTLLMWTVVTFFSGIVHSYSRRYMAGSRHKTDFFATVFGFTLVVMGLVAADHIALFGSLWMVMGLLMARLIGTIRGWQHAQAAATVARNYFVASSGFLSVALAALWWATGETTVSGITASTPAIDGPLLAVAAGALILAAMIQSALIPFHTWLLGSMTAPTPASALMHAGFVNAGGVLFVRFAPVITVDPTIMLVITVVGALSALLGKLFKSVQVDTKSRLGCSTVGQMGFMIMQAGLGFFGAAITHLILHGFYKAYMFLSSGEEVEHTKPTDKSHTKKTLGVAGGVVTVAAGLAGGVVFAALTGKGTSLDSGLLLNGLIVLTMLHATQGAVSNTDLPATYRYGVAPLVSLTAVAVYGLVYTAIKHVMVDVPTVTAPAELTAVHAVVAAGFLGTYIAIETGVYRRSERLYVAFVNATQAPSKTLLTSKEDYNEY